MIFLSPAFILISFGLLLSVLYGVISPYRDSGDLIASAFSLGVAHPPGYALYTLITKIGMEIFPFGNFGYRANFLSALWTALTAGLMLKILIRRVSIPAALISVLIWILSPSVVQLSVVSEMYTLNALFCALVLYVVFVPTGNSIDEEIQPRTFFLAFFLVGLGCTNHPTLIFVVPGILAMWWQSNRHQPIRIQLKLTIYFLVFGLIGFSLILFHPIRSFQEPLIDWGNPETFRGFWRLITRSDYGGLRLHPEESHFQWTIFGIWNQLKLFLNAELSELRWWGLLLSGSGLIMSLFQKKSFFLVISFVISGPLFFLLSNLPVDERSTLPILEPYLVMANLFALFWIAECIDLLTRRLNNVFLRGIKVIQFLLWGSVIFLVMYCSYPDSRRGDYYAYDYGKNIFKTMPVNSSFYDPDDMTAFTLSYFQIVEGYRKDVVSLMTLKTFWGYEQIKKRYPEVMPEGNFGNAQDFISALLSYQVKIRRPIFSDHSSKFTSGMENYSHGLLSRSGPAPSSQSFQTSQEIFNLYIERAGEKGLAVDSHSEFFTRHLLSRVSAALNNIGIVEQNHKRYDRAEGWFRRALRRESSLSQAWNNLGINFYMQGNYASAEKVLAEGVNSSHDPKALYYPLALAQKKLGKKLEAGDSLQMALKYNPDDVNIMNEIGLIYLETKNWEEARIWFERCVKVHSGYSPAYYNLGLVYRAVGRKEDSANAFDSYLSFSPQAEDVAQVRQWISDLR